MKVSDERAQRMRSELQSREGLSVVDALDLLDDRDKLVALLWVARSIEYADVWGEPDCIGRIRRALAELREP